MLLLFTTLHLCEYSLQNLVQSRELLTSLHATAGRGIDEACKELDRGADLLAVLWKDLEHTWRTLRCVAAVCRIEKTGRHTDASFSIGASRPSLPSTSNNTRSNS